MRLMADLQIFTFLVLTCLWAAAEGQLSKLKSPRQRAGSSKFSLNPLKPLMNLMRQDPMKAAAQRHHVKYLPPPPGMFPQASQYQPMVLPSRNSLSMYGMHPYRPYPSYQTRYLPPSTISLMPQYAASPASHYLSTLINDHHHYKPLPSDVQFKAVRIPSKNRRPSTNPSSVDSLNIADSVVRQLLDMSQQKHNDNNNNNNNPPSVLVIEDPDMASSSGQSDVFGDTIIQQPSKVIVSPPVHAEFASDSSADMSSSSANSPEVFVIVSKNKSKNNNNNYYLDDKKSEVMSSSSSSPKLKKYKITSAYDENGDRQVWIIK